MQDISKLCMICLSVKNDDDICPRCKKKITVTQDTPLLPLKSIINERYCIAKAIKKNGEGVTYAAYDLKENKAVSIREFFPEVIVSRSLDELTVVPSAGSETDFSRCRADFIELWTKLMRLRGLTALVTVTDVFQANSTAYAVYEESERLTLSAYLRTFEEGYIPWEKARILFMPVLSTLGTLHTTGVFHRGINPSSFVFSKDGKLKLTDFSIEAVRTLYSDLQPEIFDGYAPLEQYASKDMMGSWSDIYSFCCVLYRTLIGARPIDAKTRAKEDKMMIPAKFADSLPSYVINALINGMQVQSNDRTQTVEQLRETLSSGTRTGGASGLFTKPSPSKYVPSKEEKPVKEEKKDDEDDFESFGEEPASPMPQEKKKEPETKFVTEKPSVKKEEPPVNKEEKAQEPLRTETPEERRKKSEELRARREEDEKLEKENKKKVSLLVVMCIILVAILAGIGFTVTQILKLRDEKPVAAPEVTTEEDLNGNIRMDNFIGLKIDDVLKDENYNSRYTIKREDKGSASVNAGTIMKQSIDTGTPVAVGTEIVLTVSKGPSDVKIPNIAELDYDKAEAMLIEKGIKCKKSGVVNDGLHKADTVKEVVPEIGTAVKQGSTVTVVVWLPDEIAEETTAVIDLDNVAQATDTAE